MTAINPEPGQRVQLAVERALASKTPNEFTGVDFKREWPRVKKEAKDWNKFLQDVCAFGNAGQDALLIYGLWEEDPGKKIGLVNAPFSDTGYDNPSSLQ